MARPPVLTNFLAAGARCIDPCVPDGMKQAVRISLLAQIAQVSTTPSALMTSEVVCIDSCIPKGMRKAVIISLLLQILGGGSGPPDFPLAAPLSPSQFTVSDFGGGNIGYNPTGIQLAGFVISRYRGSILDPWLDGLTISTTGAANVVEGLSPPSHWEVEVAWALNDSTQLSDWSAIQVVLIT